MQSENLHWRNEERVFSQKNLIWCTQKPKPLSEANLQSTNPNPTSYNSSETWTMTPKQTKNCCWYSDVKLLERIGSLSVKMANRRKYNFVLYNESRMSDKGIVVSFIKIGRLIWAWHLTRSPDTFPPRRVFMTTCRIKMQGQAQTKMDEVTKKIRAANWQQLALHRNN